MSVSPYGFDPTGVETGGAMAQVQADVLPDLNALIGTLHSQGIRPVNVNGDPLFPIDPNDILIDVPAEFGRSYIDDMAIGTTWQDVATVSVPRLTLRINPTNGNGTIVNNSSAALQLNGYSLESESGALNGTGWNSLDEQNVGNWQQNEATANLSGRDVFYWLYNGCSGRPATHWERSSRLAGCKTSPDDLLRLTIC